MGFLFVLSKKVTKNKKLLYKNKINQKEKRGIKILLKNGDNVKRCKKTATKLQKEYKKQQKYCKNITKILQKIKKCYIIERNGASMDNIMHCVKFNFQ